MFRVQEDNKKQALKNLINFAYARLEQCDIADAHRTIVNALEMSKNIGKRFVTDQDHTAELNLALNKLKEMLLLKSQVMDYLEIAKINFRAERDASK